MATDLAQIVEALTGFYDFAGKAVVIVGAGDGRLVDFVRAARRVTAIDDDEQALERLHAVIQARSWNERFVLLRGDFATVQARGDVVVFEFCLHEMADPKQSLAHARTLARDVVVIDHAPGSLWSWYAGEDAGVDAAWAAVEQEPVRARRDVDGVQHFDRFDELADRMASQGTTSRARIEPLRDRRPITIPMPCRLVLLSRD